MQIFCKYEVFCPPFKAWEHAVVQMQYFTHKRMLLLVSFLQGSKVSAGA